MNKNYKNITLWVVACCFVAIIFHAVQYSAEKITEIPFSKFVTELEAGKVNNVVFKGQLLEGKLKDSTEFTTNIPHNLELSKKIIEKNVEVSVLPDSANVSLFQIFIGWLPLIILIGIWIFMMRQVQVGGGKAMSFGKSKAKLSKNTKTVTFEDVAGVDEAREELSEIVDFLKAPAKFKRLGGKIPRGVLLVGSPGTGKTLLARAIAGEAGVPFFSISGSEFVEMFVGVGASRVRDMFEQGKKNAPCIIFIDEIDAVGRHRGFGLGGGNDEREQTLNQLLVEMDGFEENDGVIIISATNRPDVLDPALLRPGRFDRQVVVPLPDLKGREKILRVHMKKTQLADDVDPLIIARGTPGFSGADLSNLVNEAALLAARSNKKLVGMYEFESAKDKVMMGAERKSMLMSDEDKKRTAYHEAGHAVVALHSEGSDPIHKATIIPRGRALGMVMRLPEQDKMAMTRQELEANLAVSAGGRIAEEMIFGDEKVTTGASSDIANATKIARRMIIEWGMGKDLGFLSYAELDGEQNVFLGHSMSSNGALSEEVKQKVDEEIRNLLDSTYKKAKNILKKHKNELELLANTLLERETLSGEEIRQLLNGETLAAKKTETQVVMKKSKTRMPSIKSVDAKEEISE